MKKLLIISLLFIALPARAMEPKEKVVVGVLGAAFFSYCVYELLIKDPQVGLQEQQKRREYMSRDHIRIGTIAGDREEKR